MLHPQPHARSASGSAQLRPLLDPQRRPLPGLPASRNPSFHSLFSSCSLKDNWPVPGREQSTVSPCRATPSSDGEAAPLHAAPGSRRCRSDPLPSATTTPGLPGAVISCQMQGLPRCREDQPQRGVLLPSSLRGPPAGCLWPETVTQALSPALCRRGRPGGLERRCPGWESGCLGSISSSATDSPHGLGRAPSQNLSPSCSKGPAPGQHVPLAPVLCIAASNPKHYGIQLSTHGASKRQSGVYAQSLPPRSKPL